MTDYRKYINALRKCAKEHDNDTTYTGHIIISDLCRDTAILLEALEQEPCEDAISRKEVLNQIFYSTDNSGDVVLGSVLRHRIENLTSVKPQEPKTGRWIYKLFGLECSNCHRFINGEYDESLDTMNGYSFCPHCGAKMEREDKA